MRFKKLTAIALSAVMATGMLFSVPMTAHAANPHEAEAAELDKVAYSGSDLGATYSPNGTNFKVWAPSASKVVVNLYTTGSDTETGAQDLGAYDMEYDASNGVWYTTIRGDQKNIYYTYSVTVDGKTQETVDIYAKAAGVNGDRGMIVDLDSTDPEGWENDEYVLVPYQTDANVWEIHVKDFSYDESSGVSEANKGKYLAFTETGTTLNGEGKVATGIDYLKELGINYVHINPFYDFGSINEAGDPSQFNWGYDPKNYNVPEGSYSSNPYDGNVRIEETKEMIKALHDAGIGVIMDVVYNHTYVTDSWFQKTVPNYYYRFNIDGSFASGSGCGNDTASEREMFGKYMVESVKFWAEEYHIDGFRFDLMGLHDVDTMNEIRAELDTIDDKLIMYGEGWTLGTNPDADSPSMATQANADELSDRIGFFNDEIRDGIKGSVFAATDKGYIQGVDSKATNVKNGIVANTNGGNWTSLAPSQTVTYASAHDNHTLYDRLVNSMYGEVAELYPQRFEELIAMNKLSAAITFTSQGTPFILAGEEFARTKYGDHNSYMSSDEINNIDWNRLVEYQDLVSYYAGLIELRNTYDLFRTPTNDTIDNKLTFLNTAPGVIAYTITDPNYMWENVAVAFNNKTVPQTITVDSADEWVVLVNDSIAGVGNLGVIEGNQLTIPAQSALVVVDKASYDASGVTTDRGIVTIQHVNKTTGEVIKETSMSGIIGNPYFTTPNAELDLGYDLVSTPANAEGTFSQANTVVTYEYEPFTLDIVDLTGDGTINSHDVLELSKAIAEIIAAPANADVNLDGVVSIADKLLYQRYMADMEISGVGQVVIHYIDNATGEEIALSTVIKDRTGREYNTIPQEIKFYVLDESKYPSNASGTVSTVQTDVYYYYNFEAVERTVHVKLLEGQTWVPNLYTWDDTTFTGEWPGTPMEYNEETGWYELTFACAGYYNFIVNNGSGQTIDLTGYETDVWAVANYAIPSKLADDFTVYTENPDLA